MASLVLLVAITAFLIFLLFLSIKRVGDGEHGVVFHMGAPRGGKRGPGFVFLTPFLESMTRVDVRPRTTDVTVRERTLDGCRVEVEVVVRYRVFDPERSVIAVENHARATRQVMEPALRSRISQTNLDELINQIESVNQDLENVTDELTSPWGVEIMGVRVESVRTDR